MVSDTWEGEIVVGHAPLDCEVEYEFTPGERPYIDPRPGNDDDHPGSPDEVRVLYITAHTPVTEKAFDLGLHHVDLEKLEKRIREDRKHG